MKNIHAISFRTLTLSDTQKILDASTELELSGEVVGKIQKCRTYLDKKMSESTEPIYGINTGFGSLYHRNIA
ncbi:MAG: aromatic amino acid lyase, partial [Bacteroidetes bacterium]|nr:aromatic amino acid lyase [Bacteroidota bacterium]